jgi:hypothetical protein
MQQYITSKKKPTPTRRLEDDIAILVSEHVTTTTSTATDSVVTVGLDTVGSRSLVGRRARLVGSCRITLLLALDLLETEEFLTEECQCCGRLVQ